MTLERLMGRLRREVSRWLTDRATIYKETENRDVLDEPTKTVVVIASDVPCRVLTGGETLFSGGISAGDDDEMSLDRVRIVLPYGTVVDPGDNEGWDFRIQVSGRVYRITQIRDNRTDAVDVQVLAARIR